MKGENVTYYRVEVNYKECPEDPETIVAHEDKIKKAKKKGWILGYVMPVTENEEWREKDVSIKGAKSIKRLGKVDMDRERQ